MLGLNVGSSCQFVKGCQMNTAAALILSLRSFLPLQLLETSLTRILLSSGLQSDSHPRIGQTVTPERRLDFVRRTLIDSESTMTH